MNPKTLLNQAAKAIECRELSLTGYYHVAFMNGQIDCIPSNTPLNTETIFATFSDNNLRDGLTTKQWDELSLKIIRFYEKETIKCQAQKH